MAKRRKSRLSGSPEHHMEESIHAFERSLMYFGFAKEKATARKCGEAFDDLVKAERMRENGVTHAEESEESMPANSGLAKGAKKQSDVAAKIFRTRCLIKGSGLAGLRRRRRK